MPYKRGKKWVGQVPFHGRILYAGIHDDESAAITAEQKVRFRAQMARMSVQAQLGRRHAV